MSAARASLPSARLRFVPPQAEIPTELVWLLAAAFARRRPPAPDGDPAECLRLARLFDLGPRIVARHGAARVESWLAAAGAGLVAAHRRAVALALPADPLARRLAAAAARLEQPMIFLKGYAFHRLVAPPAGARPFIDLDVLVPRRAAEKLHELLVADGWQSVPAGGNPQHLPPLTGPEGMPADVHFRLRGVRVAAERWATADELLAAGLCRPLAALAPNAWLPEPRLLAAHLAAHAIEQHGLRPATYPLLRAVADLADLAATAAPVSLEEAAWPLVRESVAQDELAALFALGRILAAGRLPAAERGNEQSAELLLRHTVAATLDADYRHSLTLDHTTGRLRQAREEGRLMRYIADKLAVPAGPVEVSGPPTWWRLLGRRLGRPFQLGGRLASATAARLRRALDR